jgi:hypothetical protein
LAAADGRGGGGGAVGGQVVVVVVGGAPALLGRLVNWLDTALHITALHHGLYVGAIPIWGWLVRPNGRAS